MVGNWGIEVFPRNLLSESDIILVEANVASTDAARLVPSYSYAERIPLVSWRVACYKEVVYGFYCFPSSAHGA